MFYKNDDDNYDDKDVKSFTRTMMIIMTTKTSHVLQEK